MPEIITPLVMNIINPFGLLFLAFIPLIILLYLLKLRRKPVVVPSIMLWQRTLRELEANTPFQRLRKNMLLWLQILIVLLLALTLARPFFKSEALNLQTAVLVIDASASMQATDVPPSRFEAAKTKAEAVISGLGDAGQGLIIIAGRTPQVVLNFTQDKQRLRTAIQELQPTDTRADLRAAMILASSLLTARQGKIYMISDGAQVDLSDLQLDAVDVEFVAVGKSPDNLAITALDVRKNPLNPLEVQAFVSIRNYGAETVEGNLEFYLEQQLVDVRPVQLRGRSATAHLFENFGLPAGLVTVKLDVADPLPVDNVAYTVLTAPRPIQILLVSADDYFLERALNLNPQVKLFRTSPADYPPHGDYDLTVFDGYRPEPLPAGNLLLINTPVPPELGTETGQVKNPPILDWQRSHPVMRFVDLEDVQWAHARHLHPKPGVRILAESTTTPLILAHENMEHRLIYLGFDLLDSNLPLRASFPIFVTNAVQWLTYADEAESAFHIRTGEPYIWRTTSQTIPLSITTPTGEHIKVSSAFQPVRFTQTSRVGAYQVQMGDSTFQFVANLLDEQESNLQPQTELLLSNQHSLKGGSQVNVNREVWRLLALLVVALMLVEWWVYHRRIYV
ncbi:MAG: VWA domain-containing protein [Gemmatimonadetes bacterium]|nr:MAG: VWA domain-containing protein [Gemmatimonadota bacterium]